MKRAGVAKSGYNVRGRTARWREVARDHANAPTPSTMRSARRGLHRFHPPRPAFSSPPWHLITIYDYRLFNAVLRRFSLGMMP